MILGTGETGMDLAYESVKAGAKEVVLCTRGGFLSFPKVLVSEDALFTLVSFVKPSIISERFRTLWC
jgi:cation diffusion facilitator CzcD-associated flavoprotein CzcO